MRSGNSMENENNKITNLGITKADRHACHIWTSPANVNS